VKPSPFAYKKARSLEEAVTLLADKDARLLAGGQSLIATLNMRLSTPSLLIDITGIPELTRVDSSADYITLGACVTSADVEDRRIGADTLPP
jgi:carbon-monoxide dehydrogenase medium subunit